MARKNAVHVEGVVVERLSSRTFRVKLSNGHQVFAFVGRRDQSRAAEIAAGNQVMLEMSLYDLSEGRIILENNNLV
jgi:translation initiation factor IF-1